MFLFRIDGIVVEKHNLKDKNSVKKPMENNVLAKQNITMGIRYFTTAVSTVNR